VSRPLVVSDCDEVLLHMVRHFRDFLAERHEVDFHMNGANFYSSMRCRQTGEALEEAEMWRLLNLFFDTEMDRQEPIEGALEAIGEIAEVADVVVLTNLKDHRAQHRTDQLAKLGVDVRVFTNQGPKGPALEAIMAEYRPSASVFIDDIAGHHQSALECVPQTARLHFCGEPLLAPHIECAHRAGHAHARIDNWAEALPWLLGRLREESA